MQVHFVGYFFEHGGAVQRAELVKAFILKQVGVRGAAAANSLLGGNPGAAWSDVLALALKQQEEHRQAVRAAREQQLGTQPEGEPSELQEAPPAGAESEEQSESEEESEPEELEMPGLLSDPEDDFEDEVEDEDEQDDFPGGFHTTV